VSAPVTQAVNYLVLKDEACLRGEANSLKGEGNWETSLAKIL
jgi:hypothetical protein